MSDLPPSTTVVVTGAAGWLGQNLVRALRDRQQVRCLVASPDEGSSLGLVSPAVEVIVGDVRDPVTADRLFAGIGEDATVFHAAAVIHPRRRVRELFDVNVGGTQLVLDRARRAGVRRFVHVSSNSPFGANGHPLDRFDEDSTPNPYMAYGRSKLEAEGIVARSHDRGDITAVIVRPPWFYGPFQPERQSRWFAAVRRGRFPVVGDGRQRRSMVYAGNLVHGLLRAEVAGAAPGRAWWIADPDPYELREILETVRTALEAEGLAVSGRLRRVPRAVGTIAEVADRVLQSRGRYQQAVHVLGELKDTIACDVSAAQREIGYAPSVGLLEGMRASIRWGLERGMRFE
ncbi:MAG TPA: NAD(P)-dependent oxidoreductase [Acidimicrobiales bacterium]|nr:NAD(P)-dependent oxidoreductase [Acidimicrobiales bacterium]